ncbi:hypothetical protein ACROYT_G026735 [Oculina patagonica]
MQNLNILFKFDFHTFYYLLIMLHLFLRPQQVASSSQGKVFKSADIMLGGLFPVHKSAMDDDSCTPLFKEGVVLTEAMVYAVKYVNENNLLPYDISLGYDIRDTCSKVLTALKASLDFVNGRRVLNERNSNSTTANKNPVAVLGAGNSVISSAVNNILSMFRVPQIGYASTSRLLSNKNRYPTFLRTVPPDSHQGRAIAKIVSHFGWNYVALLASDDIYGRPLAETFKNEAKKCGVCLAIDILIPYNPTAETIRKTVCKLHQNKNIEVILLFTSESEAADILHEAARQKLTQKIWIGSDSWADSPKIAEDNAKIVDGMFRIINQPTVVPDFMKYFYKLNPFNNNHNSWFNEFWESIFQCSISEKNLTSSTDEDRSTLTMKNCTGKELLGDKLLKTDAIFSRVSYVVDAVLSVVYSVRKICQSDSVTKTSGETSRKKACINRVTPSSVLSLIFNITFTSVTNRTVSFDKNGNSLGRYDIINLQNHGKDGLNTSFLKIGEYDGKTESLTIDSHAIHWPGGVTSPPNGRCSLKCPPGTFKVVMNPICCWECKPCPTGSISDASGVSTCTQCHSDEIPNDNKTKCIVIPTRFLRWDSSWAWVLTGTVILCELACFTTVGIFLRHKETPIVKAANREISFLLLFGLMMGFLIPLAYIGKPTDSGCKMQVILFGTSFAFSLSIVLARINRTIVIFRYSKVSPKNQSKFLKKYLRMFLYNRTQIMLALFFTVIELLLCFAWLLSSPPLVTAHRLTIKESLLMCDTRTSVGQIISNAFIIFLSLLCTFVAFKSRKLPQNYNEAKFISFAMFVFNFVWLTFVGAFYGTPDGQHNVIINCFAILASNFAILSLIFGPKLYIILFRPGLNQMAVFRALTARYTFKASRRSSAITSDMMGSSCILKENKCVQTCGTITEEHVDERTVNGLATVVNDVQACKENTLDRDIRLEATEKRAEKLMRSKWGRVRRLNTKAVSDSALNKLVDNVKAPGFSDTERIRGFSTNEEARKSLITKESVEQEKSESLYRNSSFNRLKCPLIAIEESKDTPICILSLKRKRPPSQGTEQNNSVSTTGKLESEV